jgi:hypothetical protein
MKNILLASLVTLLVYFVHTSEAKANYEFYTQQSLMVCGKTEEVMRYAEDHDMIPFSISFGRQGSNPDGEIVYIITHWVQQNGDEQMTSISIPNGNEMCMLYHSFDTQLNPSLGNLGA